MSELNSVKARSPSRIARLELDDSPADLGWSSCGRWLSAITTSGIVHLLDTQTGAERAKWPAHEGGAQVLAWHPQLPLLATGGQDGRVVLWLVDQEQRVELVAAARLDQNTGSAWIENLRWRPDGRQLAASCGNTTYLLDRHCAVEHQFCFPGGTVGAICWRPKGAQLAVAGYGGIRIHSVLDQHSKPQDLRWKGSLLSLDWSPDAKVIAAGCQDNTVHFWRFPELRDAMMSGFAYKPTQLSWSNNSRWLLTGGSPRLILWPFDGKGPEGRTPATREFHQDAVCAISVAASGTRMATGCRAGQLAIWNQLSDSAPAYTCLLDSRVEHLAWSLKKDAPYLASTSRYGILELWEATTG